MKPYTKLFILLLALLTVAVILMLISAEQIFKGKVRHWRLLSHTFCVSVKTTQILGIKPAPSVGKSNVGHKGCL